MKLPSPKILLLALLTALCLDAQAGEDAAPKSAFDLQTARLGYRLVHPLHKVSASCGEAEGRAVVRPGKPTKVQVRAKVACFVSGDGNRDTHMREVTHEPLHPYVELKGTLEGLQLPLAAQQTFSLQASVTMNDKTQAVTVSLTLKPEGAGLRGTFSFPVSLTGFDIERPSLLGFSVEDAITIDGDLLFQPGQ